MLKCCLSMLKRIVIGAVLTTVFVLYIPLINLVKFYYATTIDKDHTLLYVNVVPQFLAYISYFLLTVSAHAHLFYLLVKGQAECRKGQRSTRQDSRRHCIILSVTQNSQDHGASFCLVQGRSGCDCCVATERATPTITISAKVCSRRSLNAAQRENSTTTTDSWDTTNTYITS